MSSGDHTHRTLIGRYLVNGNCVDGPSWMRAHPVSLCFAHAVQAVVKGHEVQEEAYEGDGFRNDGCCICDKHTTLEEQQLGSNDNIQSAAT